MRTVEEDEETARVYDFTLVMSGDVGLFECHFCYALCRRDGLSGHSVWHGDMRGDS